MIFYSKVEFFLLLFFNYHTFECISRNMSEYSLVIAGTLSRMSCSY